MGLIRTLPGEVADLIAAGEVVERPASVLRELTDNALDAGARRIEIDLEDGGRVLVSVADDGCGMTADDARLAFDRHATSKISGADDLDRIATLGFRGEALAAIGAVARVELVTRAEAAAEAHRVVVDHGRRVLEEPAGRSRGTTVAVHELFSGVPARRKFLKSPPTELDHCLRVVQRTALTRPGTGFRVRVSGRSVLELPPVDRQGDRVAAVLGRRWGGDLLETREEVGDLRLVAWAARAEINRPSSSAVHVSVNGRPVRDPMLLRAVADAFRHLVPAGRYPVAVIDLRLPPGEVDVNVHPAKSEVRFARPREVRALVVGALRRVVTGPEAIPPLAPGADPAAPGWVAGGPSGPEAAPAVPDARLDPSPAAEAVADGPPGPRRLFEGGARSLAQYADCFILAEDDRGLLIVDQHVAHERLLFETLFGQAEQGPLPRQALIFQPALELGPRELELLERHADAIARLGYRVERFGPETVRVREVPAVFGRQAKAESLTDVLASLDAGGAATAEMLFRSLLATLACHGAVRKGMPLSREKMDYILGGLAACELPTHCPHGRVVSIRVDLGPLEREFGR